MDANCLRRLELLNQLRLTESEKESVSAFIDDSREDAKVLGGIDTESVERMVHVMPILTVVREDKVVKKFEREDLQKGAPETDSGYWCVPRVVE